jgi:hypothetical protein
VSNIPYDSYAVEAVAVDAASNSTVITEYFTVTTNVATLQLNTVGPGIVSGATNGELFAIGSTFVVSATANPGQLFYGWNNGSEVSLNPVQTNTMTAGLTLAAIFIANNAPNMIAFTYPQSNGIIGPVTFNVTGTISNVVPVNVTCQIFSNMLAVSSPLSVSSTTDWSVTAPALAPGFYTLFAIGADSAGHSTMISEGFTVALTGALGLVIAGRGSVAPVTNGEILPLGQTFQVTATPGPGEAFYTWNNGTQISGSATQSYTMASGLTLTATFIPSNTAKGIHSHPIGF